MKTEIIEIHPCNPQNRTVNYVVKKIISGAVIIFPTDSGFSIGSNIRNKKAVESIRKIRNLSKDHDFTLMINSISQIGKFAKLDNDAFRVLKRVLPGPYTFILEARKIISSMLVHPKKKTIGIRISNNLILEAILRELDDPIMCVSLIIKGYDFFNTDDILKVCNNKVDIVIKSEFCPPDPTTVIDLSKKPYELRRLGAGDINFFNEVSNEN